MLHSLDAELKTLPLSKARSGLGLSAAWVRRLQLMGPDWNHALIVRRCMPRSHAHSVLREGDLILAVDGHPVVTFRDVETIVQRRYQAAVTRPDFAPLRTSSVTSEHAPTETAAPSSTRHTWRLGGGGGSATTAGMGAADVDDGARTMSGDDAAADVHATTASTVTALAATTPRGGRSAPTIAALPSVLVTVLRDGVEQHIPVMPSRLNGVGTSRLIHWCGLLLQEAHEAVEARGFIPTITGSPPYVSRWSYGSPAHKGGLRATNWIVEINGVAIDSMDSFLDVVKTIGHATDVRLRCVDLLNRKRVFTLRTDHHFWPAIVLRRMVPGGSARERAGGAGGTAKTSEAVAAAAACDLGKEWQLTRIAHR